MKNIDPKSLIIGVLATALVFACTDSGNQPSLINNANAATGVNDKWDNKQEWEVAWHDEVGGKTTPNEDGIYSIPAGWEPFAKHQNDTLILRRRVK